MQLSAPPAVQPFYTCATANNPIVLFRGRVDLVGAHGAEQYRGGIVLDWLPSPVVRSWVRGTASQLALDSIMGTAAVQIVPRTPPRSVPRQPKTTRGGPSGAGTSFETGAPMLNVVCGNGAAMLSHALLHVANFPRLPGRPVAWEDGSVHPGRLRFEGAGWTVVLDQVLVAAERESALKNTGGYAFTHTARVERTSGVAFTTGALMELVEAFTYFCWLCAEARCGPMLPVGFDHRNRAVWSRWSPTRTESFTNAATWLDAVHASEAETLFPTFMARFQDPYWRQVLIHAIEYLVEAGRPHTVQRAIIMAQLLLEAVSYSWLVEERKRRTRESFERRKAAQNIRATLADMGVPVSMPKKALPALAATRTRKGHLADGPEALVLMRNDIVHRRGSAPTLDYQPLIDAWRLGAWYCELAVLRICGFNGLYRSRLSADVWTGAVQPVPWR